MVSLGTSRATVFPPTCETEVVGTFSTNVVVTEMEVEQFGVRSDNVTVCPLASLAIWVIHG